MYARWIHENLLYPRFRQVITTNQSKEQSNCCRAELVSHSADEGTGYYSCSECEQPCDSVTKSKEPCVKCKAPCGSILCEKCHKETCLTPKKIEALRQAMVKVLEEESKEQWWEVLMTHPPTPLMRIDIEKVVAEAFSRGEDEGWMNGLRAAKDIAYDVGDRYGMENLGADEIYEKLDKLIQEAKKGD